MVTLSLSYKEFSIHILCKSKLRVHHDRSSRNIVIVKGAVTQKTQCCSKKSLVLQYFCKRIYSFNIFASAHIGDKVCLFGTKCCPSILAPATSLSPCLPTLLPLQALYKLPPSKTSRKVFLLLRKRSIELTKWIQ